jgi:trk system potassium uptake protein TrkA
VNVAVVGAGEVGSTIAESLCRSHDVTVVDADPERVETLTYELDVLAIEGDGTDVDILREAGVGDADMLIASTDIDETNLVACGTAKALGDPFTIARVKRPQFLETWRLREGTFGVDFMVGTDLLAAEAIVGVIGLPTARDVDTYAGGSVQMAEFEVPPGSPVADRTVAEADTFEALTFAAVIRDDEVIVPSGGTVIRPGDDLVVIGTPDCTRRFSGDIAPQEHAPREVVIAGGGEIGYQTARLLERRGFQPRLVEQDPDRARWLAEQLPDSLVMESDATDRSFLERENIGMADVFVATLDNDQQNLLATLLAQQLGADRTVAIVEDIEFNDLFEAVGVDVAVSPRKATAEEITRFTRGRRAENVSIIENDRAEVLELEVDADSPAVGRSIRDIAGDLPDGVVVGAITRDGEFITPRGDTVIGEGDHVVVFLEPTAVEDVSAMF